MSMTKHIETIKEAGDSAPVYLQTLIKHNPNIFLSQILFSKNVVMPDKLWLIQKLLTMQEYNNVILDMYMFQVNLWGHKNRKLLLDLEVLLRKSWRDRLWALFKKYSSGVTLPVEDVRIKFYLDAVEKKYAVPERT